MKKYINELTNDELRQVFDANKLLQDKVYGEYIEDEGGYLSGIMFEFGGCARYTYDFDSNCAEFCLEDNIGDFIGALRLVQNFYCFLPDEANAKIDRLEEVFNGEEEADEIETNGLVDELEKMIAKELYTRTQTKPEYIRDYFVDFCTDESKEPERYYIFDGMGFELYEDIQFTKCYA